MESNGFILKGKVRESIVTGAVPCEKSQIRDPADNYIALIMSIMLPHWSSAQKDEKGEIKIILYFILCQK